jgi:hypothetical protein
MPCLLGILKFLVQAFNKPPTDGNGHVIKRDPIPSGIGVEGKEGLKNERFSIIRRWAKKR